MSFVKTENLKLCCYQEYQDFFQPPVQQEWIDDTQPCFYDIEIWESIYNEVGNLSVYAAWSPRVELFIVVHSLLYETSYGIIEFFGTDKMAELISYLESFNVYLPYNNVYIDPSTIGYFP